MEWRREFLEPVAPGPEAVLEQLQLTGLYILLTVELLREQRWGR
jgi:hypothetical protein